MQNNNVLRKLMARCLRNSVILSCILCFCAALGILGTLPQAQALSQCKGDPIVKLSNGVTLQATVSIAVASTQVGNLQVTYTFHVPVGVSAQQITYTGGVLAGKEKVLIDADQASNTYSEQVLASASYSASVTTTTTYKGQSVTFNGTTNQPIIMATSAS